MKMSKEHMIQTIMQTDYITNILTDYTKYENTSFAILVKQKTIVVIDKRNSTYVMYPNLKSAYEKLTIT